MRQIQTAMSVVLQMAQAARSEVAIAMGREVRAGRPVRGSQVWAARNTRDADMGVALAQMDVSTTPVPRPGPPDRRALMAEIVYQAGIRHGRVSPMSPITAEERTEILTHPGRLIPPVQVSAIRQSGLPPVVHCRN